MELENLELYRILNVALNNVCYKELAFKIDREMMPFDIVRYGKKP